MNSWLVLLAIILIFFLIVHIEFRLEAEQHYRECYLRMNSKRKADKYICRGVESSERCKKCPYYKKYLKEVSRVTDTKQEGGRIMDKDYNILNELTPKTQELHRAIFDKGYTAGYKQGIIDNNKNAKREANDRHEQGYQEGLDDAWQYMKKIVFKEDEGGIPVKDIKEMFNGDYLLLYLLKNYSIFEVMYKIKAYEVRKEQLDEIKVGDEVTDRDLPAKGIVTRANEVCCYVMWGDGSSGSRDKDDLHKTGKHIDGIAEILKQIKEGQDEAEDKEWGTMEERMEVLNEQAE